MSIFKKLRTWLKEELNGTNASNSIKKATKFAKDGQKEIWDVFYSNGDRREVKSTNPYKVWINQWIDPYETPR